MAEPVVFSFSVTKYFTPLLAPSVSLNSNCSSNVEKRSSVTISPPFCDSPPEEGITLIMPSWMLQPLSGNEALCAPRQPRVVEPSNNKRTPRSFSMSDSWLGRRLATKMGGVWVRLSPSVLIRMLRHMICLPGCSPLGMACTCRAMNPLGVRSSMR